jgi:hypothetical protein
MKILILIVTILLSNSCIAQTVYFVNYKLSDIGYISIPEKMEIQSGKYKKLAQEYQKEIGKKYGIEISGNRIVFQQKGLNNFEKGGFSSYARVILETDIGNYGDYEKLNTNYAATQAEINELNQEIKSQVQQSFAGTGLKIIKWYGMSIVKVNGKTALKISYLRKLKNNPNVMVNLYSFQNNDRMHRLTLSYRQLDESSWKPLYSKILNSFTIINIR